MSTSGTLWVVDDQRDLLLALEGVFADAGFDFRGFEDPLALLAALDESDLPDLFAVDLNLPNVTGSELIKILRAREDTADIPIVVITAMSSESSVLNAFKAGADDVVRKPFGISELLARITWQMTRATQVETLRQENEDLQTMSHLAKTMSESRSLPDILRDMIDVCKAALKVERVSVYLVDQRSKDLHRAMPSEPSRAEGSPNMILDLRGLRSVADALARRTSVLLKADETDVLLAKMGGAPPTRGPAHSSAVFPMLARDELVGILVLVSAMPAIGVPRRESSIATIVSDLVAAAVLNSREFSAPPLDPEPDTGSLTLSPNDEFLRGIVESSPNAVVAADRSGRIMVFNRAAEQVLGWPQNEAIGQDVRRLYPVGGAERVMHMLRSQSFGGRGRLEEQQVLLVDAIGNEIPVGISAALVIDSEGEEAATVGIFTDMRSQIQMEERLQEATESLERSRRQAVAAELAGAAAHELNQPLTSLLGYAELLRKQIPEGNNSRRPVDKIYAEARRIADIVRKIGRITDYRTKEYIGGTRIVDLDQSSEVEIAEHKTGERQSLFERQAARTEEYNRTLVPGVTDTDDV